MNNLNVDPEKKLDKAFADIGEEVGGPHGVAAKNVAMTLILSKLGPGAAARLPHLVSGTPFNTMRAVVTELKAQFHDHERAVIEGDEKAFETGRSIVEELDIAVDFLIDAMNFGRERPLHANGDVPCDINDGESMEIRDYLGNVARAQADSMAEA